MNTGQTLLSIGAFILLSVMILRVNSSFLSTDTVVQETKFGVLAVSLASSFIEEASKKSFDEATIANSLTDSTQLSYKLGLESHESYSNCDDFDDYNGLDSTITNLPSATFRVKCKVSYINSSSPDGSVNHQTWNKKLTVSVSSPFSRDTVKLSSVFSYFYFR